MKETIAAAALFCAASVGAFANAEAATRASPAQGDVLAAESLRHSAAALVNAPPDTPARAARLVVIARFAERLDPTNPAGCRLLANIYEIQGKPALAGESLAVCLRQSPTDHALGVRWLTDKLAALDNADQRIKLLRSVTDDESFTPALRAEAAVRYAAILDRQGRKRPALDAFRRALMLTDDHPVGLRGVLALQDKPTGASRVRTLLGELRGNPLSVDVAWELARVLNGLGLHEAAVEMFDYAWSIFRRTGEPKDAPPLFVTQYFNAMLDARRPRDAVDKFRPILRSFPDHMILGELMIEALRSLGEKEEARRIILEMEVKYKTYKTVIAVPGAAERELGWFYLIIKSQPALALIHAQKATNRGEDADVQLTLGAAELLTGRSSQGKRRLRKLMNTDIYAAAFLAEHYFAVNDKKSAREAIAAGAAGAHAGPAFRRLLAIARDKGVEIPPPKDTDEARKTFNDFDREYLRMGLNPEKFLSVSIRPLAAGSDPGEPITIEAAMTNRGTVAVPVGDWGLVSPVMSLQVEIAGPPPTTFGNLPLIVFPAPRRLEPGQTITSTARLDVGALDRFLAARPLDELELTVSGIVDPVQRGREFSSAVPSLSPNPVHLTRRGLLSEIDRSSPEALRAGYQLALGRIVRKMNRGDLPARMLAARQVASLLAVVARAERREANLPPALAATVKKPVLLAMLRVLLADKSPVVRAETLTALGHMTIDRSILMLLGGLFDDPDPLVRMRAAELLGASKTPGRQTVLTHLSKDSDELVRRMANAFLPRQRPKR